MLLASRDLAANRIDDFHLLGVLGAAHHLLAQSVEQGDGLGRLREEVNRAREVNLLQIGLVLDNDGAVLDLSRKAYHLGMAPFAQNHHLATLRGHLFVGLHNTALQACHHRTGGVNQLDIQQSGLGVGGRRFSMGADKETRTTQLLHIGMRDGPQSQLLEALYLHPIVDNIAQRIDRATPFQGLLGLGDGANYAKAKTRFIVNLDLHLSTFNI